MCSLDYDLADFYSEDLRTARKEHRCSECDRMITKNETYKYVFAVYAKSTEIYKTCSHCLVGQDWLLTHCGVFLHRGLEEEIEEHALEYRHFGLYRFLINMRKKWNRVKVPTLKHLDFVIS